MKLLNSILAIAVIASPAAFAKKGELTAKCADVAQEAAVKANQKMFGAETGGCGIKALHIGDQLETYLTCVSDETDPSEWIVVVERDKVDKKTHKIVGHCNVKYTGYAVDAATPDFE